MVVIWLDLPDMSHVEAGADYHRGFWNVLQRRRFPASTTPSGGSLQESVTACPISERQRPHVELYRRTRENYTPRADSK